MQGDYGWPVGCVYSHERKKEGVIPGSMDWWGFSVVHMQAC